MFGFKKATCSKCGKEKKFNRGTYGGSICESGHLICNACSEKSFKERMSIKHFFLVYLDLSKTTMGKYKSKCPVCGAKLRRIKKADLAIISEHNAQHVQSAINNTGKQTVVSQKAISSEKTFYDNNEVVVTNVRFLSNGETYAMSGVTSVKMKKEEPSRNGSMVLGIIGVLFLMPVFFTGQLGGLFWFVVFMGFAVFCWKRKRAIYHIVLRTASGESQAHHSHDKAQIFNIVQAVNKAIVHRG